MCDGFVWAALLSGMLIGTLLGVLALVVGGAPGFAALAILFLVLWCVAEIRYFRASSEG